jgi:hypothetical protein
MASSTVSAVVRVLLLTSHADVLEGASLPRWGFVPWSAVEPDHNRDSGHLAVHLALFKPRILLDGA